MCPCGLKGSSRQNGCDMVLPPVLMMCGGDSTYTLSHVCGGPVFFTTAGQIQFVRTLLRLTYEAAVNENHISVIGHPIIPFVQTRIGG